jgi:antitoxin YefM
MTAVSISHARENLFPLVRQVNDDHTVIEIVARNGGNAVLMSAADYESLQETLHLFSTRANAVHILRGLAEARDGRAEPLDLDQLAARYGTPTTPARTPKPTAAEKRPATKPAAKKAPRKTAKARAKAKA